MTEQWVVILRTGDRPDDTYVYGPLADKATAGRVADFLTTEIDPARAYLLESPVPELLLFWNRTLRGESTTSKRAPEWPPSPGDIWEDRNGDRWICTRLKPGDTSRYLTCIARQADDSAEEIWRLYGPMKRHTFIPPNVEEPPF